MFKIAENKMIRNRPPWLSILAINKYISLSTCLNFIYVLAAIIAEKQVKEVEAQASLLLDRLKPLKMLEENLNRNLSEIKELISQARKQAASVSSIIPDLNGFTFTF